MKEYSIPKYWKEEYTCPHCNVLAKQKNVDYVSQIIKTKITVEDIDKNYNDTKYIFGDGKLTYTGVVYDYDFSVNIKVHVKQCNNCDEITVWKVSKDNISDGKNITLEEILYPKCKYYIEPNPDMPDELKKIYDEARTIFYDSPKAAGALLRSVLEALVKKQFPNHKDEKLGSIFYKDDVKKIIPDDLLDLLKQLKNIGNDASHPALLIYEDEDKNNVECLFGAINLFVEIFDSKTKTLNNLKKQLQKIPKK